MAGELIGPRPPAFDRLKRLFFPENVVIYHARQRLHINHDDSVVAEYLASTDGFEESVECRIESRFRRPRFSFTVGKKGLEKLWFGDPVVAVGRGENRYLGVERGITITREVSSDTNGIEKEDKRSYQALGEELADWLEEVIKNHRITEWPVRLNAPR